MLTDLFLCCLGGCGNFKVIVKILYWRVTGRAICLRHPMPISHSAQGHLLPDTTVTKTNEGSTLCCFAGSQARFCSAPSGRLFTENLMGDAQKQWEMLRIPRPCVPREPQLLEPRKGLGRSAATDSLNTWCQAGQAQCPQEWSPWPGYLGKHVLLPSALLEKLLFADFLHCFLLYF